MILQIIVKNYRFSSFLISKLVQSIFSEKKKAALMVCYFEVSEDFVANAARGLFVVVVVVVVLVSKCNSTGNCI